MTRRLDYRDGVLKAYGEVYTRAALDALDALAPLNRGRRSVAIDLKCAVGSELVLRLIE